MTSAPLPHLASASVSPGAARAGFSRAAGWVLVYTVFVILFGAVVRITGSGAGCGQHWPTCQGEIVHLPTRLATWIELSHRVTSGLSALVVFALTGFAFRRFPSAHAVRRAAVIATAMMIVEALIGAVLVRLALVAGNTSAARAIVMPLHLISTSILTAALALCWWWSRAAVPLPSSPITGASAVSAKASPRAARWVALAALGVLVVSAAGAVTALGDTVYPVRAAPLAERLSHDQHASAHFLERLRVLHPLLAVLLAAALFVGVGKLLEAPVTEATRRLTRAVAWLTGLQVAAGGLNVMLSAPGWLQVLHLLIGTGLWLGLILLVSELYAPSAA
ncbi:MAG TPA: COX15/CtaA family protein [Polyangiaceae bacterium]|nr:COX15/CtaA family protein [Polyangiaceae bacterium]